MRMALSVVEELLAPSEKRRLNILLRVGRGGGGSEGIPVEFAQHTTCTRKHRFHCMNAQKTWLFTFSTYTNSSFVPFNSFALCLLCTFYVGNAGNPCCSVQDQLKPFNRLCDRRGLTGSRVEWFAEGVVSSARKHGLHLLMRSIIPYELKTIFFRVRG
jgi:hypothetical protein